MKHALSLASITVALTSLVACQNNVDERAKTSKVEPYFVEAGADIIPFEQRKRRKWDNAVVADLDQDGLLDIVTTDHGAAINIFWNIGDKFAEPVTILRKDTHGVSVADYDNDGKMELMVVQGGGNGKKPKFPLLFKIDKNRKVTKSSPFEHFEFTRGRASKFIDANNDGELEFIQTGFPLKSQTEGANFLYELDDNGVYQYAQHLPQAKWLGYRSTVTDINQDGDQDVFFYGGEDLVLLAGGEGKSFHDVTKEQLGALKDTSFVSSISPIDFDNDGDLDFFVTRAKPQFHRQSFYDHESKNFAFFAFKDNHQFPDLKIEGDFNMSNLQQAYPDFDVYLGQSKDNYKFQVDRHGHKDLSLAKEQAKGWPKETDEKGVYIGYLGQDTWRILVNNRSRTAGVVHQVEEEVTTKALEHLPAMLWENTDNGFIDSSEKFNINITEQTISAAAGDFNNDGWVDVMVIKYGNMATKTKQTLLLNDQGKGFNEVGEHNVISQEVGATGGGAEALDFDRDGDLDVLYANERGQWHLFINKTPNNHNFLVFNVGLSPLGMKSNMGARVTFTACNNQYQQTVGQSSAPFSQNLNSQLHFGLGSCQEVSDVKVRWSNGEMQTPSINELNLSLTVGHEFHL